MGIPGDRLRFVSAAAAEIDRLVVRGHELAGAYGNKPPAVAQLKAFPHLLNSGAIVLLQRSLARADVARIMPYTPRSLVDGLMDNNVDEGIVQEDGGHLVLTDGGREAAEGVVTVQEAAAADAWSAASEAVAVVERLLSTVVAHGRVIGPPRTPSNFELFVPVCDRPTAAARALRLLWVVRYWRSDAHGRALADADLQPFEAHALSRLWDAHRGLDRVGQGFPEPGRKGVASLEARGLADGVTITQDGIALREQVEHETDRLTAPIYDALDQPAQDELLGALTALPT